jgi:hypothetical protein
MCIGRLHSAFCDRARWRRNRNGHDALSLTLVGLLALPPGSLSSIATADVKTSPRPFGQTIEKPSAAAALDRHDRERAREVLEKLPLHFIANEGQADSRVAYYVQGSTTSVYFTRDSIVFALSKPADSRHGFLGPSAVTASSQTQRWAVRMSFDGANPGVKIVGQDRTAAVVSYFTGDRSQWKTGLPTFGSVVYEELWPGIDLVYGSSSGRLKYTFLLKPGADPARIRLRYEGATSVRLTEAGRLQVETPVGGFEEEAPYAYQEEGDHRAEVAAEFRPEETSGGDAYRFGFRVGEYDRTKLLVLDPIVLAYAGYIGGSGVDDAWGVAVDASGNAYVVGRTQSSQATFPATVGPDVTYSGGAPADDAFIAKVDSSGATLVYCGYIGGTLFDIAYEVAVDGSGAAYVAGTTASTETSFPVIGGPDLTHNGPGGGPDAWVAKVDPGGTALVYSGYIGGSGNDEAFSIAVDGSGNAYVAGNTTSTAASFPETVGPDVTPNGGTDAWVGKVNAAGTGLDYCGYLGGTGSEQITGIAVDGSGNAYVGGQTGSTEAQGFPVLGGPDLTYNGNTLDGFVAKVDNLGTGLVYSGYVGGSGREEVTAVAVDASGNAYLSGTTESTEATFPVTVGPDLTFNGGTFDGFVAKLDSTGTTFVYSGYVGGSGIDRARDVAINSSGGAYVAGFTDSNETTFPVTGGPDLTYNGGLNDAYVAMVTTDGTAVVYCGYIGGSGDDQGQGVAVDGSGFAYVVGGTPSSEATFPATGGPDTIYNGAGDAFIAKVDPSPSAVGLLSFEARASAGAIELSWETASELRNLGFHLYRASEAAGPYERITSSLIPGLSSSPSGASYSYRDSDLQNGTVYFYLLEDVETTGRMERHGPVSATPQASGTDIGGGGAARIAYGDPSVGSLRILKRGAAHAVLELTTGGFYAIPLPDGSVRIEVPGFEERPEPGSPAVPVKRAWIEAVSGRKVKLASVEANDIVAFTGLRPVATSSPVMTASEDGTVRAGRKSARARFRSQGLYPEEAARMLSFGFQGEVKKAQIELSPLRWDSSSGEILLARRLIVRIVFAGREPEERSSGGSRGRRHGEHRTHVSGNAVHVRLVTRGSGLYAVRFEEIFGARRRALSVSRLSLGRNGQPVAFHVEPEGESFGPGSVLYFVSEGASLNPYGNEAVYELTSGEGGAVMSVQNAAPWGSSAPYYWQLGRWEQNRYYQAGLLEAPDLWLWDTLVSPVVKDYSFTLSSLAPSTEPARLVIELQGSSDFEASPDHHVRASVNGTFIGEASWDGKLPQRIDSELPAGVLREGDNVLQLENVGDTGAAYSMVFLNRFALTYARLPASEEGRLQGSWTSSGTAEIVGLGSRAFLLETSEPTPRWLHGAIASPTGLQFRAEAGGSYLAVAGGAVLKPELRRPTPGTLTSTQNRADYVLIAPRSFLTAAQPLLERRRSEGLLARGVAIEEIYEQFGYGEPRPEAVKEFLSYAYHHWQSPSIRYVVLLGDATYDFKNVLGREVINRIPPLMVKTSYLWTASDPTYAAINGEDLLPDIAIGRLPASSLDEAERLVGKILTWEAGRETLSGRAVLVADNADSAGNFEANADQIASTLLASREVERIHFSQLGPATGSTILASFDRGASLMSYIGHGGIALWASEDIFNNSDVSALAPQAQQPLVLTLNCLNGYFHFPWMNSLSEELLKAEGKGAIAAFSPSGLSLNDAAHVYHQALVGELVSGRHKRLGDAILAAQAAYADSGAFPELLSIYHLLGDPALTLR